MPGYSLRSLDELGAQARGFFTQTIPGAIATLVPNTFTVVGKVLALLGFEHELRRQWLFRQMFASTADEVWLRRHGYELGLTQTPASVASGTITIAANPGSTVPSGLLLVGPDGTTFTTVAGAVASGNSVTLPIEADAGGLVGNVPAGTTLTLDPSSAIVAGLGGTASVGAAGLTGGGDAQPLETFRARVLTRKRQPPQGGSRVDYQLWVGEVLPTVQDVFVDSFRNDARSVWVQFTVQDQPNGIPTPGQVALVQAYLDDPIRRPVTARVFASAPIPVAVPILIGGLRPDTPATRAAVAAELAAVFVDRAEPGRPSGAFVLSVSWLNEAISRATGEDRHRLVTPPADVSFEAGTLPVLGAISYTS